MISALNKEQKKQLSWAHRFIMAQALSVLLLSLLLWMGKGSIAAYSALAGGFACILPNLIFARSFFSRTGAQATSGIIRRFYIGEATKLLVTGCLCGLILSMSSLSALPFFAAFILAQSAFFWASGWIKHSYE